MSTISDLPDEMISIILSNNDISIQDIVNVSTTSNRFYDTVEHCGNTFWQRKFYQRWSGLKRICEEEIRQKHTDFKELVKTRIECRKRLRDYLAQMNKQWFLIYQHEEQFERKNDIYRQSESIIENNILHINMEDIHFLINQKDEIHSLNYYFLMDELTSLFKQSGHKFDELTNIFYGKKLLPYLKHYHLRNVWQKFINRPAEQQLVEEIAAFFVEWYHVEKDISYSHIETELDNYAYQTMEFLRIENPKHPIFSISHEQLSFWKYNNINEDHWNEKDTRKILNILCKVLETKIDYIISQTIIFHGVARRLGIRCDITCIQNYSFGEELFLIWKPKYNTTNLNNAQYFNINGSHYGFKLSPPHRSTCRQITIEPMNNSNTFYRLNSVEIVTNLSRSMHLWLESDNLFSLYEYMQCYWLFELQLLVQPFDITLINLFIHYCNSQKMDLSPIIIALEKIFDNSIEFDASFLDFARLFLDDALNRQEERYKLLDKKRCIRPKPKRRKLEMKFAVGMIVLHKYRDITGVIIGWENLSLDELVARYFPSSWCYTIRSKYGIFYRVPQELLKLTYIPDNDPIHSIEDIGKYFCKFNGTYYIPNETMREEYEEDVLFLTNCI